MTDPQSRPAALELVELSTPDTARHYDAVIGTLVEATASADPVVEFEDHDGTVVRQTATSTVLIEEGAVGHPVMLMFLRGDLAHPVIIGLMQPGRVKPKKITRTKKLALDGREMVLEADTELTLRCGKSSITLTKSGKIVLQGTYLLSRASSVNRIRGGTIELN